MMKIQCWARIQPGFNLRPTLSESEKHWWVKVWLRTVWTLGPLNTKGWCHGRLTKFVGSSWHGSACKLSAVLVVCVGKSPRCGGHSAWQGSAELSFRMRSSFWAKQRIPPSFPYFQLKVTMGKKGQCSRIVKEKEWHISPPQNLMRSLLENTKHCPTEHRLDSQCSVISCRISTMKYFFLCSHGSLKGEKRWKKAETIIVYHDTWRGLWLIWKNTNRLTCGLWI